MTGNRAGQESRWDVESMYKTRQRKENKITVFQCVQEYKDRMTRKKEEKLELFSQKMSKKL